MFFGITSEKARAAIDQLHADCRKLFEELKRISLPNNPGDMPAVEITTRTETTTKITIHSTAHFVENWKSLCVAAEHYPSAAALRDRDLTYQARPPPSPEFYYHGPGILFNPIEDNRFSIR
jgi:hypothetical protein